VPCYRDIQHEG